MHAESQLLLPTPPEMILWDIIDEHADQAEFCYIQWRAALYSHLYTLERLANSLEPRLEAHLDGLVTGGPEVADRLLSQGADSPDRMTLATLVLLATGSRRAWCRVFDLIAATDDEDQRQALGRALSLYDAPSFDSALRDAFDRARTPEQRAGLLEVLADRHLDPGARLGECFDPARPPLCASALRAAGCAARRDTTAAIEPYLEAGDPSLQGAAIEAGLRLGSGRAWAVCLDVAGSDHCPWAGAWLAIALLGRRRHHRLVRRRLEDPATRAAALWALGFAGTVDSVEACLPYLVSQDEELAKLAAEAVAAITGLDWLEDDRFHLDEGRAPSPLNHHRLEVWQVPVTTARLPAPDPAAFDHWWRARRSELSVDERYLSGEVLTLGALVRALGALPMRRRHALALELDLRTGGEGFVATQALTTRQRSQLAGHGSTLEESIAHGLG